VLFNVEHGLFALLQAEGERLYLCDHFRALPLECVLGGGQPRFLFGKLHALIGQVAREKLKDVKARLFIGGQGGVRHGGGRRRNGAFALRGRHQLWLGQLGASLSNPVIEPVDFRLEVGERLLALDVFREELLLALME
jgi:hypothetical protein